MATPMSACLSAAASFTASPVIATTSPASCMRRARRTLSSGATRPNTCSCGRRSITSASDSRLEIRAGDEPGPEAELVGDRPRGDGVVAGDHADVDPGMQRDSHRVLRFRTQRIDDPDQRDQDKIRDRSHRVGARSRHRGVVEITDRERQHAQALLRQLLVRGEELVAHVRDRHLLAVPEREAAAVDDDIGRTLDRHEVRFAAGRRR